MNIEYQFIESEAFYKMFDEKRKELFQDEFDFNTREVLTDIERKKQNELFELSKSDSIEYYLIAKKDGEVIGWSFGVQKSFSEMYMVNSAIFPEYRRKGIYTEMLEIVMKWLIEKGFQRIYSLHKATNNRVIIPKLKYGFVITGISVKDMFGTLVELSYYTNPKRREMLDIRVGMKKLTAEYQKLVK